MSQREKIEQLKNLGRRFVIYPRGLNRVAHVDKISDLLNRTFDDGEDAEWETWSQLARDIIAEIHYGDYCPDGKQQVARAKALVGIPVVLHYVTMRAYVGELTLPLGQERVQSSDYHITITDNNGNVIVDQQTPSLISSSEYPVTNYEDDDWDYDGDDEEEEEEE